MGTSLIQNWRRDGYAVLPGVVPLERVAQLREQAEKILGYWNETADSEVEPGGFGPCPQSWVLLHLNHPRYVKLAPDWLPLLLETVALPIVQDFLEEAFGEPGLMVQTNLYMNPTEERIGAWHRDCQFFTGMRPEDMDAQREAVALEAEPARTLHMHIPLIPTHATEMVPGSHNRWDTEEEFRIRSTDAASPNMPGGMAIELVPGDLAFFHVNSIHRGMYLAGVPRRTIAVTFGRASYPHLPTLEDMTTRGGYVCSYQPWFRSPGYLDGLSESARAFYERFVDCYGESWDPAFVEELSAERQAYFGERL